MTTILQLAQQITEHLPGDWEAEAGHSNQAAYLRHDGERRVFLRGDGWNWEESKRLAASGLYPQYDNQPVLSFYGDRKSPRITAAISRGAEAIANDIKRRLLPDVKALVEEAREIVERRALRDALEARNAFDFIAILGGTVTQDSGNSPTMHLHRHGMYGDIEIGEETVALKLRSVPLKLGLEIAQTIADYEEKEK